MDNIITITITITIVTITVIIASTGGSSSRSSIFLMFIIIITTTIIIIRFSYHGFLVIYNLIVSIVSSTTCICIFDYRISIIFVNTCPLITILILIVCYVWSTRNPLSTTKATPIGIAVVVNITASTTNLTGSFILNTITTSSSSSSSSSSSWWLWSDLLQRQLWHNSFSTIISIIRIRFIRRNIIDSVSCNLCKTVTITDCWTDLLVNFT